MYTLNLHIQLHQKMPMDTSLHGQATDSEDVTTLTGYKILRSI